MLDYGQLLCVSVASFVKRIVTASSPKLRRLKGIKKSKVLRAVPGT